ncbi:aminodeoxychorismate lyase [Pseudidiomarina salinarum]|uniref:aminodeoxychorismate lyase n=1 Tax=Pseudidiomarina salinarum TaxID=435908 RepID=UPI00068F1EAE|nr:aminodeoxychorismate lyase [Pseudidiomarina salinarum]RUO70439.1 aminodeoxychorismate lyase [Pseudidiomarina salinarum]
MWVNGKPVKSSQLDRGLQFGDGHFTTLTIEQGRIRWWSSHWHRLQDAARQLNSQLPDESAVRELLLDIASSQPDAVVKIIITRGYGSRGYRVTGEPGCNWYVTTAVLSARDTTALSTDFAEFRLACQPHFAGLKTLNRLEQVMLSQERTRRGLDELIVLDNRNTVVEAISSNIFWRVGSQWYTPWLNQAGVAGIVRQRLLADNVLGQVQVCASGPGDISSAEQVFLCNCVLGLRPVATIGHHRMTESFLPEAVQQWWLASKDS